MKIKIPALLLSFLVAIGLWMYVVTTVSPNSDQNYYGIPVTFENENALLDRGLMLLSEPDQKPTVSVNLSGTRMDLSRLDQSNIIATVDLSSIGEAGSYDLTYRVTFSSNVTSVNLSKRITPLVHVEVAEYASKEVPVRLVFQGELKEGLILDQESAVTSTETVFVSGPKAEVDQIAFAGILVDRTGLTATLSDDFVYTLMDEDNAPVDVTHVTTDTGLIHLELPVEHIKEVPLVIELTDGGGATVDNAKCGIEPETITISGSEEALAKISEVSLGSVNLGDVGTIKPYEKTVDIKLPDNLTNRSGVPSATVTVTLEGLVTKTLTLTRDQIQWTGAAEGLTVNILTQQRDVTFRGPVGELAALTAEDIAAVVDLKDMVAGNYTLPLTFQIGDGTSQVGAFGKYDVSVSLSVTEPTTPGESGD